MHEAGISSTGTMDEEKAPRPVSRDDNSNAVSTTHEGTKSKRMEKQAVESLQDGNLDEEQEQDGQAMHGVPLIMFSVGMMSIVFLMCLDHYILATAVPRITTDFNALQDAAWYSSGYFLTNMALQPALGQAYKQFSIKRIFLCCLIVFEAGSVMCALAKSSAVLIIGRVITGAGGGGLYTGAVVLVGYAVEHRRRPMYISIITSLDGVASVAGPLIGGAFTGSYLTWRFCFWINLPIGFAAFVVLCWYLEDPKAALKGDGTILQRLTRINWFSLLLLLGGSTILLIPLQWAGITYSWSDARIYGFLIGGGIILSIYFIYQHHLGDSAAIPYRILRNRTVFFSAAFMLLMNMLVGSLVNYLPFEFQAVRGYTPAKSGTANLAFLVPLLSAPLLSGAAISLTGWYIPFMYLGGVTGTVGAGLITTFDAATPQGKLSGYQVLCGLGSGLCHQIPYTSVLHALPHSDIVPGSALCSFLNSLGSILGIVLSQAIFASLLADNLHGEFGSGARAIIQAGPNKITEVVSPNQVGMVRTAYSEALQKTYMLPVVTAGLATLCTLGVKWKRLK